MDRACRHPGHIGFTFIPKLIRIVVSCDATEKDQWVWNSFALRRHPTAAHRAISASAELLLVYHSYIPVYLFLVMLICVC